MAGAPASQSTTRADRGQRRERPKQAKEDAAERGRIADQVAVCLSSTWPRLMLRSIIGAPMMRWICEYSPAALAPYVDDTTQMLTL